MRPLLPLGQGQSQPDDRPEGERGPSHHCHAHQTLTLHTLLHQGLEVGGLTVAGLELQRGKMTLCRQSIDPIVLACRSALMYLSAALYSFILALPTAR